MWSAALVGQLGAIFSDEADEDGKDGELTDDTDLEWKYAAKYIPIDQHCNTQIEK